MLEKGAGMGAEPSAAKPGPAAHPIALPGLMRASGETCAVAPRSPGRGTAARESSVSQLFGRLALRRRSVQISDSMPELAIGARRTERQKRPATVRPPCPLLRDREPLVRLEAALGAAHDAKGVGLGPVRGIGWISHGSSRIILRSGEAKRHSPVPVSDESACAGRGRRRAPFVELAPELDRAHPAVRRRR